jgi:hypothetical protein
MKEKVENSLTDKPSIAGAEICIACIDNYDEWLGCNIPVLVQTFAYIALKNLAKGRALPSVEIFDKFCRATYEHCLATVQSKSATRH